MNEEITETSAAEEAPAPETIKGAPGGAAAPDPPRPDTVNRGPYGPFSLDRWEQSHFEKVAGEAKAYAETLDNPEARKALHNTAAALRRCLEAYAVLDREYAEMVAENTRLMNVVRKDQDRISGQRGAGGRFTPPEDIAPPPLPAEDPATAQGVFYRPAKVPPSWHRVRARPSTEDSSELKRLELHRNASDARADIRRAFQRFVAKTAGVPTEDWEKLY